MGRTHVSGGMTSGSTAATTRRGSVEPAILLAVAVTVLVLAAFPSALVWHLRADRRGLQQSTAEARRAPGTPSSPDEQHALRLVRTPGPSITSERTMSIMLLGATRQRDVVEERAEPATWPTQPLFALTGSWSNVVEPREVRVTTADAWAALWREHCGDRLERDAIDFELIPQINFEEVMVVAVFLGSTTNTRSLDVTNIAPRPDGSIVIDFSTRTFQTAAMFEPNDKPQGGMVTTQPWAIWVVPKSNAQIVLRRLQPQLKEGPVVPKVVGTIAACAADRSIGRLSDQKDT